MTVAPSRETGRRLAPPELRSGRRAAGPVRGAHGAWSVGDGDWDAEMAGDRAAFDRAAFDDTGWEEIWVQIEEEWARFFAAEGDLSLRDTDDLVGADELGRIYRSWEAADRAHRSDLAERDSGSLVGADALGRVYRAWEATDSAHRSDLAERDSGSLVGADALGRVYGAWEATDSAHRSGLAARDTGDSVGADALAGGRRAWETADDAVGGVARGPRDADLPGPEPGSLSVGSPVLGVSPEAGVSREAGVSPGLGAAVAGEPGLSEQVACVAAFRSLLASVDGTGVAGSDPAGIGGSSAGAGGDGLRIDLLAGLEALAGAVAAAQARVTVVFAESVVGGAAGRGASVVEAERGVAPQVGLARGLSAAAAEKRIALARSLTSVLPHTMRALTDGRIGEAHALVVHAGSRCLSPDLRGVLDQRIAPELGTCTPRRLRKLVDRVAADLDAAAVAARHADAVRSRGVWTRPAPDGMCYLTILGPVHQIVGAYASVRGYATRVVAGHGAEDAEGRSLSQVMTDTALTRLAGLAVGEAQPVTVNLVMTPESLYGHARNPYPSDPGDPSSTDGEPRTPGTPPAAAAHGGYPWTDPATVAGGVAAAAAAAATAKPANVAPFSGTPAATAADPAPANPDATNSGGSPPTAEAAARERSGENGSRAGQHAAPTTTGAPNSPRSADAPTREGSGDSGAPPGKSTARTTTVDHGSPRTAEAPTGANAYSPGQGATGSTASAAPPSRAQTSTAFGEADTGSDVDDHEARDRELRNRGLAQACTPPGRASHTRTTHGHAPGGGDRCGGVNTPARIVGHGYVPAPLARAWLLAGCDDHGDGEMTADNLSMGTTEADGPQHPGDHHSQSRHHPQPEHDPEQDHPGTCHLPERDDQPRADDHPARRSPARDLVGCDPTRDPADLETGTTRPPQARPRRSGADDWQTEWHAPASPKATAQAAQVWIRRAFTSPDGRDLVALETTARLFPPALRSLLILRDDTCRMPYCDAQIGHADHITPWTDGGATTLTNGQGLSIRCNYTKDLAGFTTRVLTPQEIAAYAHDLGGDPNGPGAVSSGRVDPGDPEDQCEDGPRESDPDPRHTLRQRNALVARAAGPDTHVTEFRTPTGHVYLSAAPPALRT